MEDLRTVEEVARYLGRHPETVRRMAARGELPSIKFARSLRFRPEDVDRYVSEHLRYPDVAEVLEEAAT